MELINWNKYSCVVDSERCCKTNLDVFRFKVSDVAETNYIYFEKGK